jgi:hypothetical protein
VKVKRVKAPESLEREQCRIGGKKPQVIRSEVPSHVADGGAVKLQVKIGKLKPCGRWRAGKLQVRIGKLKGTVAPD